MGGMLSSSSNNSSYHYEDDGEDDDGVAHHCCNAKRVIIGLVLIPIFIGVALIIVDLILPCLQSYDYYCADAQDQDVCCNLPCNEYAWDDDTLSLGICEEVHRFQGLFLLGLLVCLVGIAIFLVVTIIHCIKRAFLGDDSYEEIESKEYKRDEKAYTVSYDTYPPTYHSHGPQ